MILDIGQASGNLLVTSFHFGREVLVLTCLINFFLIPTVVVVDSLKILSPRLLLRVS